MSGDHGSEQKNKWPLPPQEIDSLRGKGHDDHERAEMARIDQQQPDKKPDWPNWLKTAALVSTALAAPIGIAELIFEYVL